MTRDLLGALTGTLTGAPALQKAGSYGSSERSGRLQQANVGSPGAVGTGGTGASASGTDSPSSGEERNGKEKVREKVQV